MGSLCCYVSVSVLNDGNHNNMLPPEIYSPPSTRKPNGTLPPEISSPPSTRKQNSSLPPEISSPS